MRTFYSQDSFTYDKNAKLWSTKFIPENYKRPIKISYDLIDAKTKKKFLNKGDKLKFNYCQLNLKEKGLQNILISNNEIIGKYIASDLNEKNGEVIYKIWF